MTERLDPFLKYLDRHFRSELTLPKFFIIQLLTAIISIFLYSRTISTSSDHESPVLSDSSRASLSQGRGGLQENYPMLDSPSYIKLKEISAKLLKYDSNIIDQETKRAHTKYACDKYLKPIKNQICQTNATEKDFDNLGIGLVCDYERPNIPYKYDIIVDSIRNIALCIPPKAACTTWQRFYLAVKLDDLRYLDKKYDDDRNWNNYIYEKSDRLRQLNTSTRRTVQDRLVNNQFETILNTRHPFERLYSGWKDKFSIISMDPNKSKTAHYWMGQRDIANRYKVNDVSQNRFFDKDLDQTAISFLTFVRFIVGEEFSKINEHFKPMSFHCSPCDIEYDYISRIEDMPEDLINAFDTTLKRPEDREILLKIINNRAKLPSLKSYKNQYLNDSHRLGETGQADTLLHHKFKKSSSAQTYFQNLAKTDVSLFIKIYHKFQWDFILFGYTLEDYYDSTMV